MISPTRRRGLSEPNGSWKTICSCRRAERSARPPRPTSSSSPSRTEPAVGGCSCSSALPTVVLPQPDSPTSASVRPGEIARETPSTA
jgi:hypothetical protein